MSVLVAITSCDFFDYTARAAKTALLYEPSAKVLILDDFSDGSRDDTPEEFKALYDEFPFRVSTIYFGDRAGLTRSWNVAVQEGAIQQYPYVVISNNDVVFTKNWWKPLKLGLETYDLVGPVTNAPGPTAKGLQQVEKYLQEGGLNYHLTDDQQYLDEIADFLGEKYGDTAIEARVNGFCFAAKTRGWLANKYAEDLTFNLSNTHNSRGRANHTPTMTLMEDEYQHRLYAKGGKAAVCPASFVLHYRSVWRGDKYAKLACGQTLRKGEAKS